MNAFRFVQSWLESSSLAWSLVSLSWKLVSSVEWLFIRDSWKSMEFILVVSVESIWVIFWLISLSWVWVCWCLMRTWLNKSAIVKFWFWSSRSSFNGPRKLVNLFWICESDIVFAYNWLMISALWLRHSQMWDIWVVRFYSEKSRVRKLGSALKVCSMCSSGDLISSAFR